MAKTNFIHIFAIYFILWSFMNSSSTVQAHQPCGNVTCSGRQCCTQLSSSSRPMCKHPGTLFQSCSPASDATDPYPQYCPCHGTMLACNDGKCGLAFG